MARRTRRQFLEDSMFAAATAAAVAGSASPLMGSNRPGSKSPNERLNVAVIGVKGRGNSHIGAFAGRNDTQVTWIVDADREVGAIRVEEVEKRQNGVRPKFTTDLREMLEDNEVHITSIATPNHWHALGAIWSIQAGKDVYVEKPVSHNVSEGRRIVEAARKYERICQTGTQCRSSTGLQEAIAFLRDGGIGDVKLARGLCYKRRGSIGERGDYPVPSSVDYDLWLGPAPMASVTRKQFHYDWHWQWPYGNGDLGNQGIHQMDIGRWGLGVDRLSDSIFSYGGRFGYVDAGDTANTQVVVHNFGDKTLTFEVRGLETPELKGAKVGVIFEGSDGYLVIPSYESATAFDKDGNKIKDFRGGEDHFGNFLTAVRSRSIADLNADIEEGHQSSALCHLGNISYRLAGTPLKVAEAEERIAAVAASDDMQATFARTLEHLGANKVELEGLELSVGPVMAFDPVAETFVDSDAGNAMLTREYRAPFVVPEAGKV
ncbi:MAG TPA: gfo/Idh/MocA family oxidoreductase [Planctomycetaceae bacterium]|nr:gfo/Idh/MocA family oxidoreductase [Planctomycetaceae bacterium]